MSLGSGGAFKPIPTVQVGATDQNAVPIVNPDGTPLSGYSGKAPVNLVRNDYSVTPVTTGAYVQLVAATLADINILDIFDSSGETMALAVGPLGAEVNQMLISPGGNGQFPLYIPLGSRISIIAISNNAIVGEFDCTFLS